MRRAFFVLVLAVVYFPGALSAQQEPPPKRPGTLTLGINVIQIVLNDEHRGGVDWEAIVSDFHTLPFKKEDDPAWADKKYRLSAGTVSSEDYAVLVDALDTVGKMAQLPQASVRLTAEEPLAVDLNLGEKKSPVVHLQLRLVPAANTGPAIIIEPHVTLMYKDAGKPPTSLNLKTQTQIVLNNNAIIALGGLTEEIEITKIHKFPLLGDLPLLDLVFRSQGHWMQKTETVVFLIPHTDAVAAREPEKKSQDQ